MAAETIEWDEAADTTLVAERNMRSQLSQSLHCIDESYELGDLSKATERAREMSESVMRRIFTKPLEMGSRTSFRLTEADVIQLLGIASDADSFSQKLHYLSLRNRIDEAMLAVYRRVATLRRLGDWKKCNEILALVDVKRTELGVLVALLMSTATLPRDALSSWQDLYDETYVKYTNERGEAEAAAALDSLK